jgi:hypothetical protein
VARLLSRWNFTAQKPAFRSYEQSSWKVRYWLKKKYPAIRQKAANEHGIIFWLDEVGMRSGHQAGTTFAPGGKRPVIERTGKRFYLNMISAITNSGKLVFIIIDSNFNGAVFLMFLQKLIRYPEQKVFLIADSHPVHLQKGVTKWLGGAQRKNRDVPSDIVKPGIKPG